MFISLFCRAGESRWQVLRSSSTKVKLQVLKLSDLIASIAQ